MTGRVQEKVAFITGAARGQGRSHAVKLAEEGADIIAVDICRDMASVPYPLATPEDLEETVRLVEATGRRIVARQADVRDLGALDRVVAEGLAELGRLDIIVANAGIVSFERGHLMEPDWWQDVIDVNLTGVWNTIRAAVPGVIAGGNGGSIAITSSTGGLRGGENAIHYVVAKHGVVGMMRAFALELASHHIRVNTLHPTHTLTPMIMNDATRRLFCPDIEHPTDDDFSQRAQSTQTLPVPWLDPVDISNALLFLASDEARYITGVTLPVDAGFLLK